MFPEADNANDEIVFIWDDKFTSADSILLEAMDLPALQPTKQARVATVRDAKQMLESFWALVPAAAPHSMFLSLERKSHARNLSWVMRRTTSATHMLGAASVLTDTIITSLHHQDRHFRRHDLSGTL